MLVCVNYDQFNAASVNKINELKNNPKFCSGSFSYIGSLDQLAETTGFVCYRCKEDFSVASGRNHDQCWIFELVKGLEEYMEVLAILYQAKLYSTNTASNTRGLIDHSRVMCDACQRLERPLVAAYATTAPTQFEIQQLDVKPIINRQIEVANNDVHATAHEGPNVIASQTVQSEEEVETKPPVANSDKLPKAPVQSTLPNAHEPLSVMPQRQNRLQWNIQESSQKEYHQPRTSSSYAANSAVYRNNLINLSLGVSQVEREICEADSIQQGASTNNGILDQTRITATPVREAWMNPNIFNNSAHVTSRVLDSKQNNILVPSSASETQPTSHFDVATPHSRPRPRNPTDLMNPAGHSHWAKPDLIGIGIVDGFLPIYEVNHKTTPFRPIRISELNFWTNLRFHSSLLKRKTDYWIKVKVTKSTELPDGVYLHYNYELHRKPGQMRKATKPVRLCCDKLLHFILIHMDDLSFR